MSDELNALIKAVQSNKYSFCKFISPNDAGDTGSHQSGLYIPKNSVGLLFDEPGERGKNKEKNAVIQWQDGVISDCRFIYYGQGSRNEYRITKLGKHFKTGELVVIVKKSEFEYSGFVLSKDNEINTFLESNGITKEDTNQLIPLTKAGTLTETKEISFRPKAHILVLLGEELIKSPVMAIYELIKNGYDADAKSVSVNFENIEDIENSRIVIKDDGTGITEEVLENVWFEPGTDFRKPVNDDGIRQIKRSPIFERIPMGEKGVGRFAVHKLGNKIRLISRPAIVTVDENGKAIKVTLLEYEVEVKIDWRKFSQSKYLDDVSIEWEKNTDPNTFEFKNTHGTLIQVSSLKETWTRGMARQLKRNTISMLSPKNDPSKFKIDLNFNNWWLHDIPDTEEILNKAPYKLSVFIDESYKMTFEYEFKLTNNLDIGSRRINKNSTEETEKRKYERKIKGELKPFYRSYLEEKGYEKDVIDKMIVVFDSEANKIPYGNIMLELYSFDLDSASLRDYISTPSLVKELLRDHAGIKVFKGNLRVYDYGDPGNDWLGLDIKRVNNKTWFSNNQNVGYIYLDDAFSGSLIEKTNREGFIQNDSYDHFKMLLEYILSEFKAERLTDREKWVAYNKHGSDDSFESQINDFKKLISSTDLSDPEKKQKLLSEAEKIEERYEHDKTTLLIPAGVGMTASFAMHEIEKLIPRMEECVNEEPINQNKIKDQVEELKDYADGILSVLRKGGNKPVSLLEVINQACNNYSLRIKQRNISIKINHDPVNRYN